MGPPSGGLFGALEDGGSRAREPILALSARKNPGLHAPDLQPDTPDRGCFLNLEDPGGSLRLLEHGKYDISRLIVSDVRAWLDLP